MCSSDLAVVVPEVMVRVGTRETNRGVHVAIDRPARTQGHCRMDEGRRSGTRRRPSHGSRILIRAFARTSDTVAGVQGTLPQLRAGRRPTGFLPADALDASRSDLAKKPHEMDHRNPTVCHNGLDPGANAPASTKHGAPCLQRPPELASLHLAAMQGPWLTR